jgi:hypothetical protein
MVVGLLRFLRGNFQAFKRSSEKAGETLGGLMFNVAFSERLCVDAMLARFFTGT